ncbi:cytochrome P450 [Parvularcula flava]|uniref:Cytochrome P450 n=1 Tax=Aquisalinus luteolus TaxID=1566827 RepID=A0A8J3A7I6_9PROT|nr:cytochrome P450 [Aquisalinus luteolus]NHK28388.1 cytochrome P450 [Aquisalinus luteolus]GGH98325.1 cytochrome P450 [Aquisalinus luteolus]
MTTSDAAERHYIPPMPPRIKARKPTPVTQFLGTVRYFKVMARNPLEVWSDVFYREPVANLRFLGRDYLVTHDPAMIRHVFVTNQENYRFSYVRQAVLVPFLRDGLVVAEGETWKRARKALTPVFTPRHVKGFGGVMDQVARERADELAAKAGQTVSMTEEMLALTLDILLACLFSHDADFDAALFSRRINRLMDVSGMPHPFDLVQAPGWVPRVGRTEATRLINEMRAQVGALAAARRKRIATGETVPEDFLTLLLQAGQKEDAPLSDDEIIDNLLTFMAAGHETTARTLTWTFYVLSQTPDALARVLGEVDGVPDDANASALADHMPYTNAVVKEVMRLYPAAAQLSRQAVDADEVGGRQIAPGTEIVTSTWVLHRHESLWDNPDAFEPERFMGARGETIPRHAWLPFGLGPRVCIGASFAMQEILVVMARLLQRFTLSSVGPAPMPIMRITLQPSTPVPMRIEPR